MELSRGGLPRVPETRLESEENIIHEQGVPTPISAAIAAGVFLIICASEADCNSERLAEDASSEIDFSEAFVPFVDDANDQYGEFVRWPEGYQETN